MPDDDTLGAQPRASRSRGSGGSQGGGARGRGARDGAAGGRNSSGVHGRRPRDGGAGRAWGTDAARVAGTGHEDGAGLAWGATPAHGDSAGQGDPVERARQICLRMLTAAPRTRTQLADALHRRGIPSGAADAVLGRFTEAGLIDDAAFARAWVESRHRGRGLARRALAAELRRRGVDTEEVRAAVETLSPDDELATARRLVAQRAASSRGKPQPARIRQLMGLLARKGYPAGLAYQVVREALEQERPGRGVPALEEIEQAGTEDEWPPV